MSDATITALIMVIPAFLTSLGALIVAIRGNAKVVQEVVQLKQNVEGGNVKVAELATNVGDNNLKVAELAKNMNGAMDEIKTVIGEKNLAEGKLAGIAEERDRPPLVTDPQQVQTALNGPDVRKQIDRIEAIANSTSASSERIEKHAGGVAADLSAAHARADAQSSEEPGAAADASAQQTAKEKRES